MVTFQQAEDAQRKFNNSYLGLYGINVSGVGHGHSIPITEAGDFVVMVSAEGQPPLDVDLPAEIDGVRIDYRWNTGAVVPLKDRST